MIFEASTSDDTQDPLVVTSNPTYGLFSASPFERSSQEFPAPPGASDLLPDQLLEVSFLTHLLYPLRSQGFGS